MKTFQWNMRMLIIVAIACLLASSVGIMGVWLMSSGQPGTGMMENGDLAGMMGTEDMSGDHDTMMGAPANRGILGGYTGTVGIVMILASMGMVGLLLYALFREKPGKPQPSVCWNCERPVEIDWPACPYCEASLTSSIT